MSELRRFQQYSNWGPFFGPPNARSVVRYVSCVRFYAVRTFRTRPRSPS